MTFYLKYLNSGHLIFLKVRGSKKKLKNCLTIIGRYHSFIFEMREDISTTVQNLISGSKSAFTDIFYAYHKKIYLFCRKYFFNQEDAEEVVQDVFLKLWQRRKNIDPEQNFQSYLYAIAKNSVYDSLKKKVKQQMQYYDTSFDEAVNETENLVLFRELQKNFDEALTTLPDKRREIFYMSRKEGLSNKEIAEKMGISLKTVETHISLAIQHFRKLFDPNQLTTYTSLLFLALLFI